MPDFKVDLVVCSHRSIQVATLASLWVLKECPNPVINIQFQDGDALISRSRSVRATKFLKESKSDLLMFIDDDVFINPRDAQMMMMMAYQENLPILGAAYVTKSKTSPGFAVRPLESGIRLPFGRDGGVHKMRDVSSGCMIINRFVLEKMVSSESVHDCIHGKRQYFPFFQHREVLDNGAWEDKSEDWFFCWNARQLGFEIYCDTRIRLEHTGNYAYTWDDINECANGQRKIYDGVNVNIPKDLKELILKSA